MEMSRRGFIAGTAAVGAALAAGSVALAEEPAPAPFAAGETLEADIAIAGFGAAGAWAAVEAAGAGKSVIVVDKAPTIGRANGANAGGPFVVNSKLQQEMGIPDFRDEAFKFIMDWSHWSINGAVVRKIVDLSGDTVDRFMDEFGIDMYARPDNYGAGWASVRAGFKVSGANRFQPLADFVTERGGQIIFDCALDSLIMEDGVCKGMNVVCGDGTTAQILAKKTLVATGGFLGSPDMMMEHFGTKVLSLGQTFSDGTGIHNVIDAGGVYGTQWGIAGNEFGGSHELQAGFAFGNAAYRLCIYGVLLVNNQGRRFADEGQYANFPLALGGAISMTGGEFFGITDQGYLNGLMEQDAFALNGSDEVGWPTGKMTVAGAVLKDVQANVDQAIEQGWVVKGETLEDLAEQLGAPALVQTVAEYNEMCAAGADTQFGKPASFMNAIEEGPFYAVKYRPSAWVTIGGVRTNDRLQAIDKAGLPIENLYVAGADNGSTISAPYCGYEGTSLMTAYCGGRLAGMWMAEDIDA